MSTQPEKHWLGLATVHLVAPENPVRDADRLLSLMAKVHKGHGEELGAQFSPGVIASPHRNGISTPAAAVNGKSVRERIQQYFQKQSRAVEPVQTVKVDIFTGSTQRAKAREIFDAYINQMQVEFGSDRIKVEMEYSSHFTDWKVGQVTKPFPRTTSSEPAFGAAGM